MFDQFLNLNITAYMIEIKLETFSLSEFDNYVKMKLGSLNYIIVRDVLSFQITWHITIDNNALQFFNWSLIYFNLLKVL